MANDERWKAKKGQASEYADQDKNLQYGLGVHVICILYLFSSRRAKKYISFCSAQLGFGQHK